MKVSYYKEIASNYYLVDGKPVQFDLLPGNRGVLTLETGKDDSLIAALNKAAEAQVGGISRISEADVEDKKKEAASMPSTLQRPKEMLRQMPRGPLLNPNPPAASEAPAAAPASGTPQPPETLPFPNSALRAAAAPPPAPPPESPAATESAPTEGFRPPTRRIKRTATAPATSPAPLP